MHLHMYVNARTKYKPHQNEIQWRALSRRSDANVEGKLKKNPGGGGACESIKNLMKKYVIARFCSRFMLIKWLLS